MAKIFPIYRKNITQNIVVEDPDKFVESEKLSYDLPERYIPADDFINLEITYNDEVLNLEELVEAFVLGRAFEFYEDIEDTYNINVDASALEQIIIEDVYSLGIDTVEISPISEDITSIDFRISETYNAQDVTISTVTTIDSVSLNKLNEDYSIIFASSENIVLIQDTIVLEASGLSFADQVAFNQNWGGAANSLENNTNTSSDLSASSSGLLGLNSNTVEGNLVVSLPDYNLGDLDITSVIFFIETSAELGVSLGNSALDVSFDVTINSGAQWLRALTLSSDSQKQLIGFDVTGLINNDVNNINNFFVRGIGSVTSGSGIGATTTVSLFRTGLIIEASREYV